MLIISICIHIYNLNSDISKKKKYATLKFDIKEMIMLQIKILT